MDKFDALFYKIAVLILFLITLLLNINIELLKKEMKEVKAEVQISRMKEFEGNFNFEFGPQLFNPNFSLQNLNEKSSD